MDIETVKRILEGKTKSVTVVHDHRNHRYILKRKGFRDVVLSEKGYRALLAAKKEVE